MAMAGSQDVCLRRRAVSAWGSTCTSPATRCTGTSSAKARGSTSENSAIHDTYSRCVTVHGTNNVRVENNVTFNTVGHCFFLEDAVETGNQFVHNLGIMTKCHPTLPCEPTNLGPAGSASTGTRRGRPELRACPAPLGQHGVDVLDHQSGQHLPRQRGRGFRRGRLLVRLAGASDGRSIEGTEVSANTWPRRTAVREFSGNTAHSNFDGFMFDRGPRPDGTFSVGGSNYHFAFTDPADPNSEPKGSVFENFTGYKNRHGAVWGRGELHLFKNLRVADNAIGFTHAASAVGRAAYTSKVVDSLFVGESDNIGNPRTPQEIAYGRSMPNDIADFPIRGYEYYDMRHDVENTTFVNFAPNATRDAGAISYLMYTSFGMSTENAIEGAKFVNAKPVSFPPSCADGRPISAAPMPGAARRSMTGRLGRRRARFLHRPRQRHRLRRPGLRDQARMGRGRVPGRFRPLRRSAATSASAAPRSPIRSCSAATAGGGNTPGRPRSAAAPR